MSSDISQLSSEGIIDSSLQMQFNNLRKVVLIKISSSSVSLFDIASKANLQSDGKFYKLAGNNSHSLFVEI